MAMNRNPGIPTTLLVFLLLMHGLTSALALSGGSSSGGFFSSGGGSRSSPSSSSSSSSSFGFGLGLGLGYALGSGLSNGDSSSSTYSTSFKISWKLHVGMAGGVMFVIICFCVCISCRMRRSHTSVLKLQVGLLGTTPTRRADLDRIGETTDTSTSQGWHKVLAGATTSLLQNLDYCISGCSSAAGKPTLVEAESYFKNLSTTEKETLVNFNNIKVKNPIAGTGSSQSSEYIAVTILVATRSKYKLSKVYGSSSLKQALQDLKSIPCSNIMAVHVLWTPQKQDDNLSVKELQDKYPLLKPFKDQVVEISSHGMV